MFSILSSLVILIFRCGESISVEVENAGPFQPTSVKSYL